MNSPQQGINNDLLIAEYTLGLLDLKDTAQAHALLGRDPEAVVQALKWENDFLALVDQLVPVQPPPILLQKIQAALGQEISLLKRPSAASATVAAATPSPAATDASKTPGNRNRSAPGPGVAKTLIAPIWNGIWFWRTLCVILALIMLVLTLRINKFGNSPVAAADVDAPAATAPQLIQVAILQAPGQTSTPGWTVALDAQKNLVLNPLVHSEVPADASVQLWTSNQVETQPRSLGLIDPNQPVMVPAASIGTIQPGQLFEMTVEAQGGSPTGSPNGAILFLGRMVTLQ
ncbi:MAG TPA: anti-sigma factor [Eoetvoesiella sp.]